MPPLNEALKRLSAVSQKLNSETDSLNTLVEDLERRLQGVGVSHWLGRLLDQQVGDLHGDLHDDSATTGCVQTVGYDIGYTKIGGSWCIAARPMLWEWPNQNKDEADLIKIETGPSVRLLSAPRAVRIEAAQYLKDLVTELTKKLEDHVNDVAKAKAAFTE